MFQVIERRGMNPKKKNITVTVKKQNAPDKQFNFTLGGVSTPEVADMLQKTFYVFEDKVNKSAVLEMLYSVKSLLDDSNLVDANKLIMVYVKKIRGD